MNEAAKAPGIKAAYDGLSIHPYAIGGTKEGGNPKGEPVRTYPERAAGVPSDISAAYLAQLQAPTPSEGYLGAKPLWVTEVGWPVDGAGAQHVSLGEQSNLLNDTYNWIKSNWETYNIKYAAWYLYRDSSSNPATKWAEHAGLRDTSGTFRPAWFAYESQTGAAKWPPDPNTNLFAIHTEGTTSGQTEVTVLDPKTNYWTSVGTWSSAIGAVPASWGWQFIPYDYNHDGYMDIIVMSTSHTGSKMTEMHVLNGAAGFGTYLAHWVTPLPEITSPTQWQFIPWDYNHDNYMDIVGVQKQSTGSKMTELHILNGAAGFSSYLAHWVTPIGEIGPTQKWQFGMRDWNHDGYEDLIGVSMINTGSKMTEVHIVNGGLGFSSFLNQIPTVLGETGAGEWQFSPIDVNKDGSVDLFGVSMKSTGSGKTEVHLLNGTSNYQTYMGQYPTGLPETSGSQWQFYPAQ